jgi:hypothetical protein
MEDQRYFRVISCDPAFVIAFEATVAAAKTQSLFPGALFASVSGSLLD